MLLNLINCKTFTILHNLHCCYVYIPGTTCLHILLAHPCIYYYLLRPQYTVLHILFYCTFYSLFILIFLPIFIHIILCCVTYFALSIERTGPDLHFTMDYILYNWVFVVNKEPWTLNLARLSNKAHSLNPPLMQYCHVIVGKRNSNQGNVLFITTANLVIPIIYKVDFKITGAGHIIRISSKS